jgi:hypothetical protein
MMISVAFLGLFLAAAGDALVALNPWRTFQQNQQLAALHGKKAKSFLADAAAEERLAAYPSLTPWQVEAHKKMAYVYRIRAAEFLKAQGYFRWRVW